MGRTRIKSNAGFILGCFRPLNRPADKKDENNNSKLNEIYPDLSKPAPWSFIQFFGLDSSNMR